MTSLICQPKRPKFCFQLIENELGFQKEKKPSYNIIEKNTQVRTVNLNQQTARLANGAFLHLELSGYKTLEK